jgi:hypothetical protein
VCADAALYAAADPEALERVIELLHSRAGSRAGALAKEGAGGDASYAAKGRLATSKSSKKWAKEFDSDMISGIALGVAQAAGVYASVMASLLSVFVPQLCPPTELDPLPHVCTTRENFFDLSSYNKVRCRAVSDGLVTPLLSIHVMRFH